MELLLPAANVGRAIAVDQFLKTNSDRTIVKGMD
jgi:hypothetical protein